MRVLSHFNLKSHDMETLPKSGPKIGIEYFHEFRKKFSFYSQVIPPPLIGYVMGRAMTFRIPFGDIFLNIFLPIGPVPPPKS